MTEQSSPTPTDELVSLLSWAWARNLNFPMIETNGFWATDITGIMRRVAKELRVAGWKSPAEVAELVRAAEHTGFVRATEHTLRLVSEITAEYHKLISDRVNSAADHERNT